MNESEQNLWDNVAMSILHRGRTAEEAIEFANKMVAARQAAASPAITLDTQLGPIYDGNGNLICIIR